MATINMISWVLIHQGNAVKIVRAPTTGGGIPKPYSSLHTRQRQIIGRERNE